MENTPSDKRPDKATQDDDLPQEWFERRALLIEEVERSITEHTAKQRGGLDLADVDNVCEGAADEACTKYDPELADSTATKSEKLILLIVLYHRILKWRLSDARKRKGLIPCPECHGNSVSADRPCRCCNGGFVGRREFTTANEIHFGASFDASIDDELIHSPKLILPTKVKRRLSKLISARVPHWFELDNSQRSRFMEQIAAEIKTRLNKRQQKIYAYEGLGISISPNRLAKLLRTKPGNIVTLRMRARNRVKEIMDRHIETILKVADFQASQES